MYYCFIKFAKHLISLILILTLTNIVNAQSRIDSLSIPLAGEIGIDEVKALIELSIDQNPIDGNKSLMTIDEAYDRALRLGNIELIIRSGRIKGEFLRRREHIDESIKVLKEILPIAEENDLNNDLKYIMNSLALDYTFQANYDKALEYHFRSLIIRETIGDRSAISITLNNIGLVYFKLGNFEKAIEYYKRALVLKKEIDDPYDLDRLLINIGLSYNSLKDFRNARIYIQDGFTACDSNCSQEIKIEGQYGLGVSYYGEHEVVKAKSHFIQSYNSAKSNGNKRFQVENLIFLSRISVDGKENEEACNYLHQAESISEGTEYNQLFIEIYKEFSRFYNQTKDFENAAAYQGKYIHLKDSIYSDELIRNLAKVQTDFEQRENKAIIAVNEETIDRQRKLNLSVGIIAVLSFLLIWVLYHSNKVKKKVNNALSEAKNFIELKNKELDQKVVEKTADLEIANNSLRKVNDELDNFIYKTSHDIRGPLASLKGICNVALLDVNDEVALGYLQKLDVTADHLNSILTRLLIINQINNSSMKAAAVDFEVIVDEVLAVERKKVLPERLVIKKKIATGIEFRCDKEFIKIILENLVGNAIKFFNDSDRTEPFVDIRIDQDDNDITIRVIDNGIGVREVRPDKIFQMFSRASERSSTGGIGLYITKTATEKLGGHIGLCTTPEGYTEFYVKFPKRPTWVTNHHFHD